MKKFFRMYLALAFLMLGAMSAFAGERISLQEVPFCSWDGWGADAQATGDAECLFVIGEGSGNVYGDVGVNNYADVSLYSKLIVVVSDGTPRFLLNRDVADGQWNEDEAQSHLIDNTRGGWSGKYFSNEPGENEGETIYYVDLKQIAKDKGYAHLHAIKGANWANVTIVSMEIERQGKTQQIGWTNLINNSNMEGDDASSFYTKVNTGDNADKVLNSEITDGVGVDGSRGIMVAAGAKTANAWDNQFWFRFNETVPAGTKYRVSFDYRADTEAKASTQAHAEPSDYIHYAMLGDVNFAQDWQTFTAEGEVSADQAEGKTDGVPNGKLFQSIAFNLNELADANNYYFDNIKFEIYKYGTTAEFSNDVVLVDFGFDTNVAALVEAGGKPRLLFPIDCATVKVNGKAVELYSIEGLADGRFYIFLNEAVNDNDEVLISFKNPTDAAYHLLYTSGPLGDINDFTDVEATLNNEIEYNEGYPYTFVTPTLLASDPEDGSFNLPNNIKDFKLTFDKKVNCEKLEATFNGKAMTVTPATGFAEEITLTRDGADDLPTSAYTINVTKIYPEEMLDESIFGSFTYTVNIGKPELDPDDVEEVVMTDEFANGGDGWWVNSGGTWQPANSGSGCRIITGGANSGQGYTPSILYLGSRADGVAGVALYGTLEKKLTLKTKTYHLRLAGAKWDGNGADRTLKVQVFPESAVNPEDGYADESLAIAEETKAIEPDYKTTAKATEFDILFAAPAEGNYVLKFTAGNNNGEPATWGDAVALGNVKVEYIPNTAGIEETRLLNTALENAKTVRDANTDERFAGEAYDALTAAIDKYEAEKEGYTNPSQYKNGAADLDACADAMRAHRTLCDDYDTNVKKAIDVVRQNASNKFANTELYGELTAIVAKYNGASEWRNVADTIADPTAEEWKLFYEYDELKEDEALTAAIAELKDIANTTSVLFTEGVSATGDSGVKVLVDRIRRGAELLKSLGVAEDDELIVAANNALTDDDELAEAIKTRATGILYENLKNADNELFKPVMDEETLETTTPTYDLSVFAKNPNIYALQVKDGANAENVPGWDIPTGNGEISTMWVGGTPRNIAGIAEDVVFTKYHATARYEQTIYDLPAGVYTVVIDAVSWADDDTTDGYVFVKTSDTPAVAEGEVEDRNVNFAATLDLAYQGQYVGHFDNELPGIVVTDGQLTFGANFGPNSQFMFDQLKKILLTAPATGFDYAAAYEQYLTGVEGIESQPAQVRAIELYDLNGRRITSARQGIVIVKKYMSDGTLKTEKVIKK